MVAASAAAATTAAAAPQPLAGHSGTARGHGLADKDSPGSRGVEVSARLADDELLQRQMNKSPQQQHKHTHQGRCQRLPQQVQAHFGLPLRVTAVAVVAAPVVPRTVVVLRYIIVGAERFDPPDSGVALHVLRASGRNISCERRSQASLFFSSPLAARTTDRAEGQSWCEEGG